MLNTILVGNFLSVDINLQKTLFNRIYNDFEVESIGVKNYGSIAKRPLDLNLNCKKNLIHIS